MGMLRDVAFKSVVSGVLASYDKQIDDLKTSVFGFMDETVKTVGTTVQKASVFREVSLLSLHFKTCLKLIVAP